MKSHRTTVILLATILMAPTAVRAEDPVYVYFDDPILKAAVMQALGLTTDPTPSDMLNLTQLWSADGMANLTGLEYARNLSVLYFAGCPITDLSPISGLPNLSFLAVRSSGQLADISPLSSLTSLTGLLLEGNRITDISPLSGLTNLGSLGLSNNQISDLTPLSNLVNLTSLEIEGNSISDLSPLSGLSRLETLSISGQLGDLGPLSGLTALRFLFAAESGISGIGPLSALTNIVHLNLGGNQISDISALSGLTQLGHLQLECNRIGDIRPLGALTSLSYLRMDRNQIVDLSPLAGLASLSELYMSANRITSISALSELSNLWSLGLDDNLISDISPLLGLTRLRELGLFLNPLNQDAYCKHIPMIERNNPGLSVGADPNPYNCDCDATLTPEGSTVVVAPVDCATGATPITLTFEQVTASGGTALSVSQTGPTLPAGFQPGDPPTYYDITTTASCSGLIDVSISYAGISFTGPPESLRLLHHIGDHWVNCTTEVYGDKQVICGAGTLLGIFTIVRADDYTPPVVESIIATPSTLWPPNHKMVKVTVTVGATDNSGQVPTLHIAGVIDSQGADAEPDWEITGDLTVELRAERSGSGDDRTYTIQVQCTDAAGNAATSTVDVVVPHDQGKKGKK